MVRTHTLGFPRIGSRRELKFALERYWRGETSRDELYAVAETVIRENVMIQCRHGIDLVPGTDFSFYDHVLDTSELFGLMPTRAVMSAVAGEDRLDTYFRVARGRSVKDPTDAIGAPIRAGEMTKWFDTNYHYIVPEVDASSSPGLAPESLLWKMRVALEVAPKPVKVVLPGPLTFLHLMKAKDDSPPRRLTDALLARYRDLLTLLDDRAVEWIQFDEPILGLDETAAEEAASVYCYLGRWNVKIILATYFSRLAAALPVVAALPVDVLHVDAIRGGDDAERLADRLPQSTALSVGIVDGRNVWRANLPSLLDRIEPLRDRLGDDRLWLAPSCSLLHVPYSLSAESGIEPAVASWLAFAEEKLEELRILRGALNEGRASVADELAVSREVATARRESPLRTIPEVQDRLAAVTDAMAHRSQRYPERSVAQRRRFQFPLYPTTTIGSFPQTAELRRLRRQWKEGTLDDDVYEARVEEEITRVVREQEEIGLDVLVHGEAERNDMVEYFGRLMDGYAFTEFGWVQSYGSRCVRPPIIYGDVRRPRPMTVRWITFAASLTDRPVKGMLTGPVTMVQWSFVRDDQPRSQTANQIALALRDEVADLEAAGVAIIQVDEPAFREGLPLQRDDRADYLAGAAESFRLATSGVAESTQIHTHMCYSEFNDIFHAIADLDADVITIETSRSDMELLDAFETFDYPNEIGPGVYDIHSPNIPDSDSIVRLLRAAGRRIPAERLWVNPDCGLKTRRWEEVVPSLRNMVAAAKALRHVDSTVGEPVDA